MRMRSALVRAQEEYEVTSLGCLLPRTSSRGSILFSITSLASGDCVWSIYWSDLLNGRKSTARRSLRATHGPQQSLHAHDGTTGMQFDD